jgi:molybdopterin molybdotransferase
MQEDVQPQGCSALFTEPLSARRHLRPAGSDFAKGDVIVPAGSRLVAQRLVGVAAADLAVLDVFRQPGVAIICCGDELSEPGRTVRSKGKIPESISYGIAALVHRWGGTVVARWRLEDDLIPLQAAATDAFELADVVVVIGGASVGERDLGKKAFAQKQLEPIFSSVRIKPGKPVWFGRSGRTLVMGLPGNPTSALVAARLFLAPLLSGLSGGEPCDALDWRFVTPSVSVEGREGRDVFTLVTITASGAVGILSQDSASQKALSYATHLVRRRCSNVSPEGKERLEMILL